MNKTAFVVSVVLTTFVLMAVAGVVYALNAEEAAAAEPAAATETVTENSVQAEPASDPSLEQVLLERESVYQQRIAEANARLEQAEKQLAAQSAIVNQQAASQNVMTTISSDQAMQVAADFLGQDNAWWVELVSVRGEQMYLVTFASGDLVYVNMSGQVVGSAPAQGFGGGSHGGAGGGKKTVSLREDDHSQDGHDSGEGEHETEDEHGD